MTSHSKSSELESPSGTLYSNLAQGIHAMAQPLAVLMASLGKGRSEQMDLVELRELTASSAAEVQRACRLFGCLQQLVLAESIQPHLSPTPLLPVLAYAAEGVDLLFQNDGIFLLSLTPNTCPPVLIHRARTLQALSRVLLIVHSLSRARDTVELLATVSANAVQVVIRNLNVSVAAMDAEGSLSMAVAEANMRSQQAAFSLTLQPFTVCMELTQAPSAYLPTG